ncbi:MAG: sulfatase-like hydrolase/transferase [Pirellulaceae bacterium]
MIRRATGLFCLGLLAFGLWSAPSHAIERPRPNILWITSEDNGPHLGCYGDSYADTPNLDALAAKGMIYLNCWSTAPVCAPARTTLISGLYPPSTGAEHMRSNTRLPDGFKMYPQYLREAGYYCTNHRKEDYNLDKPGEVWDESSRKAHWKNRAPGQPFFAIFNYTVSHESQIRKRPHTPVHDPAKVRVRAYHPDTPEVRQDWAQYYDKITEMDAQAGTCLGELEEAGLAEDTIVFYYGDHGSGMPRNKRWPYDSGLHVPLIVHIPAKYQHLAPTDYVAGGKSDRLVGFIDFAPTLLSLVGIEPPESFQGFAFMGPDAAPEQPYIYGFRGRMDERYDMVRVVRDKRFIYIRNYMPHKIYGQYIAYMFQTPTTIIWKQMYDAGQLSPPQTYFWESKPAEELYDLANDPDEVNNLADLPQHQETLQRLRQAQQALAVKIRDIGFLPEDEIHFRAPDRAPYDMGHDNACYPMQRIMDTAELASSLKPGANEALIARLADEDSAVRYWAAMGLLMRGSEAVSKAHEQLIRMLDDPVASPRVMAAQALGQYGSQEDVERAVAVLLKAADLTTNHVCISMLAVNALDALDDRAAAAKEAIAKLPRKTANLPKRMGAYVNNLLTKTLADLE